MVGAIVLVGIVLVVVVGFWWTRGAGGPGPMDAEGRRLDSEARYTPMGERISQPDDELKLPH